MADIRTKIEQEVSKTDGLDSENLTWTDKKERVDFYYEYGRTLPDKALLERVALNGPILDVNAEAGYISKVLKDMNPLLDIEAVNIGRHYSGKIGKHFKVNRLSKYQEFGPQMDKLGIRPRNVFMADPFDEHLIYMDRWIEVVQWIPKGGLLIYFGAPRTEKGFYVELGPEMPPSPQAEDDVIQHYSRFNPRSGNWEMEVVASHDRFNTLLDSSFTKVYDHGKQVPGFLEEIPSVFEVWRKN